MSDRPIKRSSKPELGSGEAAAEPAAKARAKSRTTASAKAPGKAVAKSAGKPSAKSASKAASTSSTTPTNTPAAEPSDPASMVRSAGDSTPASSPSAEAAAPVPVVEESRTDSERRDEAPTRDPNKTPRPKSVQVPVPSPFVRRGNPRFNPGPAQSPGAPRQVRRQENPRRLKNGIRLRRREGIEMLAWPAEPWCALLLSGIDEASRAEGLDYARAGQTASLSITPAGVEATVQGREPRPYTVRLRAEVLGTAHWDRVVGIMAREAVYSAKLLAGEMPPLVEQPFHALGHSLVPTEAGAVERTCTCDLPDPCKHVACVAALVAERLAGDPLLAFTLRGLDGQKLLERLQEARAIATRGIARAHSTPPCVDTVAEALPLEQCVGSFWRPGRQIEEAPTETEGFVPHALLKRLGQTPLAGKFPMVGLLASIYDSVAGDARALRDASDADDSQPTPAPDDEPDEAWMDDESSDD